MYTYTYIHIHTYTYVHINSCLHTSLYTLHMHVPKDSCIHPCTYTYIHTHIYTQYAQKHACTYSMISCTHTFVHAHTIYTCAHINRGTYTYIQIHTCTNTHTYTKAHKLSSGDFNSAQSSSSLWDKKNLFLIFFPVTRKLTINFNHYMSSQSDVDKKSIFYNLSLNIQNNICN